MKAVALTQPWASLVAHEVKRIETRSWGTSYRGPLAIHASKGFRAKEHGTLQSARPGLLELCSRPEYAAALEYAASTPHADHPLIPSRLPMGAIVGTGRLVDVVRHDDAGTLPVEVVARFMVSEHEEALGGFGPGRVYWLLQDFRPIEPIPYLGELGLFEVPDEVLMANAGDRLR